MRAVVARARASRAVRLAALTLYYTSIITGLALVHGRAEYKPPPYVYQAF